ncbi:MULTISPECIES: homoprotocatechuate degradation operon regulator HpaR [Rhizobium/Agrobacterium group]|uniref:Homoprotocatechuate degradation operon regulator HpaR n=2 Tax=Rhizobium/Agrobacterium group TaxID=227290 RepID=A0A9X3KQM1_9HYPH|nr:MULTISPECIES: homoprotocatechuate degradation operon regulator HpaR [Rhizobium/Agrobacterium group]MBO9126267.1 homoprotocatechuate degradation operon regulator HpaR [Rhizobium sp. 16-488-2b]MBO9176851.1 homoprotocatechuate degradation operon regulator HpaR [Rhizobium sp. 16-488-2a]MBO9197420.1 homoprotocatechuate degradation operon regulator HpaR [Rhizobium sp. 16-449-1b]MCZ7466715.1 homoprotocatechuate degradation operon regulator HpaR [Rhizobium rhizogenes]MCZ7939251.1 homoprotocatechuat
MITAESKSTRLTQDALLPRNTKRSLPIALLRAREAVMTHFRPMLAAHDLTEQQWRVIRILAENGTVDASEVVERAFILAPSLTRIIKSLEERGLILKERDEADGRRVMLRITAVGLGIIEEVTPDSRMIYTELERKFGEEKINLLLDLLGELTDSMGPK